MKKFLEEFKAFAMRGNVIDMAVGVVIGGAFGKITTSLVNDIIMPVISMITGGLNFSAWKWVLKAAEYGPNEAGEMVVTVPEVAMNFGATIAVIVDFIIVAFAIFLMIKTMNKLREATAKKEEAAAEEAAEEAPAGPTTEELLAEIRDLLKEGK